MRKPMIAGNWKLHMKMASGSVFINEVAVGLGETEVEVVLCVPFTLIQPLRAAAEGTPIKIAAQNMHFEDSGAYT